MDSAFHTSSLSAEGIILWVASACLAYTLGQVIYNLYFHPLAKFPGPASHAAFHVPYFWRLYQGEIHENVKELHEKYGEVVRVRPDFLSFASPHAWKDIYGSRPLRGELPKDPRFYAVPGDETTSIIFSNEADHSRIRKLLAHAFSDAALKEQEEILTPYFELLVAGLKRAAATGQPMDLNKWYNYLAFDIVADLCFGESFHALETGEYHPGIRNTFQAVKYARILRIASFYQPAFSILRLVVAMFPSIQKARDEHQTFTQLKTAQRLDMKTNRKDFMTYIQRYNDERGMSRFEIMTIPQNLLVAGSETTATLLSGATYCLLANPACYKRVQDEVRSAFARPDQMTLASTSQLPYLQAVLEEALRIYPPIPTALPRRTTRGGDWVAGMWVPEHTTVAVPQWTVTRSPHYWTAPETFAPERWLETPPATYKDDHRAIHNPFSVGPRDCIGRNLAYTEMRSVLARVLWHFDLTLEADSQRWTEQKAFLLWDKPPLYVKMTVRKDAHGKEA